MYKRISGGGSSLRRGDPVRFLGAYFLFNMEVICIDILDDVSLFVILLAIFFTMAYKSVKAALNMNLDECILKHIKYQLCVCIISKHV